VGTADELIEAVDAFTPDVAVVDIRMPPTFTDEGLLAAVALRHQHPDVSVLVFSQWVETRYATELLAGNPEGVVRQLIGSRRQSMVLDRLTPRERALARHLSITKLDLPPSQALHRRVLAVVTYLNS
jgi:hypothetical protein